MKICEDFTSLGLMGRKPACPTSDSGSNPSWDAVVHPVFEICVNLTLFPSFGIPNLSERKSIF